MIINSLLVIILAFILGCMCSGMMKQMCGSRLVEGMSMFGTQKKGEACSYDVQCYRGLYCAGVGDGFGGSVGHCTGKEDDGIFWTGVEDVVRGHLVDTDDSLWDHIVKAV